jgi:membrane-associated phospholipid phosphatase
MAEAEAEAEGTSLRHGSYIGAATAVPPELAPRSYALEFFHGPAHGKFDFPFPEEGDETYYETDFRPGMWAPEVFSVTLVQEFMRQSVDDLAWDTLHKDPRFQSFLAKCEAAGDQLVGFWKSPDGQSRVKCELNALREMMEQYRASYLGEIFDQQDGAPLYWMGLLNLNRGQHPSTFRLINISLRIGELVAMHYKDRFNRPRPSTLVPALVPPFGPPGHPAFPSGHATQSMLMSLCLMAAVGWKRKGSKQYSNAPPYQKELCWLARRVAVNREIGGFHYPSDTAAGFILAQGTFKLLLKGERFRKVLEVAHREWGVPEKDDDNLAWEPPDACPDEKPPCAP